ncbi:MAG: cyclic nucleotide-binding domain-containing protein [Cyanobacteria bacterium P01_F01_bin.86]
MKRALFILGVLGDEDVDWLVSAGHRREIASNEVLIQEQVSNAALYLILSGQFVVSVARSPQTKIAHLFSGEVVGEMSFVDQLPSSATVTAAEPSVVLEIGRTVLNQKLAQDVGFACRWYQALAILLSTRLRGTVRYLEAEFWQPFTL